MTSDKKSLPKILIIIPNLGRGGAQKVFHQQFEFLSKEFDVTACVFNWEGAFDVDHKENIISLDVSGGMNVVQKIRSFFLRVIRLKRIKERLDISISISHLEGADYINILSQKKEKVICWIHGSKFHDANISGWLGFIRKRFLMPYLYNRANQLITVSQGIANELSDVIPDFKSKLKVIYNGFHVEQISSLSMQPLDSGLFNLFDTSKVLITHCRLSRQKNLEGMLTIYSKIDHHNTKLVIIGDGELRNSLVRLCSQLGLSVWTVWDNKPIDPNCNVYFIGQQKNPFNYLRHASIYIMTSGWEGFPLALCEAMACGLPVITSDCFTGPREIIAPEITTSQPVLEPYHTQYGVLMPLVNQNDSLALAIWVKEIQKMLTSQDLNLFKVGVDRITEFELSKSMDQTLALIDEMVL